MKDKDGYKIHVLGEVGFGLLNTEWMYQKPKSKIIAKIPMNRLVITEDGGCWEYWFIDNTINWRFKFWTFYEK